MAKKKKNKTIALPKFKDEGDLRIWIEDASNKTLLQACNSRVDKMDPILKGVFHHCKKFGFIGADKREIQNFLWLELKRESFL